MKYKYKVASILIFCFSVILIVSMIIHAVIDYQHYLQHLEYSAPFSVNLIYKSVTYGTPIIIGLVLSYILKRKSNKNLANKK